MTPEVRIQKTDGNLSAAANTERILAIIGPASSGTLEVAKSFTNKTDVVAEYGSGLLPDVAAYMISLGIPVVCIRGATTTAAAYGAIQDDAAGTAVIAAGATAPDDDYDVIVEILTGGALGTAGITWRDSLDGGASWSNPKALGTSLTLTVGNGVSFALTVATNTLLAGDKWSCSTSGPKMTNANLANSFAALRDYSGDWLRALVLADADSTILGSCNTFAASFHAEGKRPEILTCSRVRGAAETRDAFTTVITGITAAVQTAEVSFSVDHCEMVSTINGRRLRRPQSVPFAARTMINNDAQDTAAKADGALPGVFLETFAGVKRYHDEFRFPGLDVLGCTTLRTWGGRPRTPGVYVCNGRVLSGAGSDYRFFQLSAVVNRVIETTQQLLEPKLSMSVLVDTTTGRIREDVAVAIEEAVNGELRSRYTDPSPPLCSGVRMTLSRVDNILSTDTVTFNVEAVPLGYVKKFNGRTGLARVLRS